MVDHGPAVVLARLDPIDFVAAKGSMLGLDQSPRPWLEIKALRIPMSEAPYLGMSIRIPQKGIASGRRAVDVDTENLPVELVELLRLRRFIRIPGGEIERAIGCEAKTAASVIAPGRQIFKECLWLD